MAKSYYLKYDDSREKQDINFHHFLWGFLLPALHKIINNEEILKSESNSNQYYFHSSNPIMNAITNNLVSKLEINYSIANYYNLSTLNDLSIITVPRWDHMITEILGNKKKVGFDFYLKKFFTFKWLLDPSIIKKKIKKIYHNKYGGDDDSNFIDAIINVRSYVLNKLELSDNGSDTEKYIDKYLILRRSTELDYHKKNNLAYGASRRNLVGIDETSQYLREQNIPIEIFEPGVSSISQQIAVFNKCKGIIGIRGAEFANIIWMRPNSKLILIQNPGSFWNPPLARLLAPIFSLDYHEIITDVPHFPKLDPLLLVNYLNNDE